MCIRDRSSNLAKGGGVSNPPILPTGASNLRISSSAILADISAPNPPVRGASCTTTARPVLFTLSRIVSASNGDSERTSMTSTSYPSSPANSSAAARTVRTCAPQAITVQSLPSRTILASPKGSTYLSSGTSIFTALYIRLGSMNMTGSGSAMAPARRPLASYGSEGITTFNPGNVSKHGFHALRVVLQGSDATPIGHADHHGNRPAPPAAIPHAGRVRHKLIVRRIGETRELNLCHRPVTGQGHAYRHTHYP